LAMLAIPIFPGYYQAFNYPYGSLV